MEGEWIKVQRRRRQENKGWNDEFIKAMKVVDLYLAYTRTKLGTRFGFVRFINVGDTSEFEKKLRSINIGNTKLLINIAKKEKKHNGMEEMGNVIDAQANKTNLTRLKSCGLSILCEWQSEAKALECLDLNKVNLSCWLSNLDMRNENLKSLGRLTWLEIEGLPTLVWDPDVGLW
uniref:Nucleotide-binding alpha-beta plait domain-containing protein n=1 Tax=Tanacetum cinerariifolium TaxID=118510 RepID=A0A6L2LST5_TANCI|nr:nucleotide-binding alpha-beta plait domain-containing protein [Tanacetum cinerariifolium]